MIRVKMKKFYQIAVLQIFIAQFALPADCWGNGFSNVNVRPLSVVESRNVRLADIATITGDKPDVVKALQSIVLTPAPVNDRSLLIGNSLIKKRLLRNGFDLKKIKFIFPEKIAVEKKLTRISEDQVKEAIREYIYKKMPWGKDQAKVTEINHKGDIVLPGGEIKQEIIVKENNRLIGRGPVYVEFKVNGKVLKHKKINAVVEVLTPVVLATVFLKRGRIISRDDVYSEKMWTTKASADIYNSQDDVIGKKVRRNIKAGQTFKTTALEIPEDVLRGDRVTIVAETRTLRIAAPGIAGENGKKGETIRVKNINSKKIIYARVIDNTTVKVDF